MKDIIKKHIALADIAGITFILILIFGFDNDVIEKNIPIMVLVFIVFYILIKWIFQRLLDDSADREEVDKEISLFIVIGIFFLLVNNTQFLINIAQIEIVFTEKYLKGLNNFLNLSLLISVELLIYSSMSYFFEFNRKTTKESFDKDGLIDDLKISSLDAESLSAILTEYGITAQKALDIYPTDAEGSEALIAELKSLAHEGKRIYDENYTCEGELISTNSKPLSKNMAEDLITSPKHIAPIRLLLNATKIILIFTAVVITPIIFDLEGADYIRNLAASAGGSITVLAIIFREGAKSFTAGIRIHMDDLLTVGIYKFIIKFTLLPKSLLVEIL